MKTLLILFICPMLLFGQVQIGQDIDGEADYNFSGGSVSISSDGTIVAIGAEGNDENGLNSGHVRVYENNNGVWEQIGDDIDGEAEYDHSGDSVSLSSDGSIVAIGAPYSAGNGDYSGHVRVYENNNGVWVQIGDDIDGEAINDNSGASVSLSSDGSIIAIGAEVNDGNGQQAGHVRVYGYNSGVWEQIGQDIDGEATADQSGSSVSLSSDGSIVAIGAELNDGGGQNSGHVRVYGFNNGVWEQIGQDIDGELPNDSSGSGLSISSDGSIVAIGAIRNNGNGIWSGHVRIYENNNGVWEQVGEDIDGEASEDIFGYSVSLSANGSIIAIGAPRNDGHGNGSGHVRIYENINGVWEKPWRDIDGEEGDNGSGANVSISSDGTIVAIGATGNNGINGDSSGHVRVYDLTIVLAVNESIELGFSIFPNPARNMLNINLQDDIVLVNVDIYNTLSQMVLSSKSTQIDVSSLVPGTYFLEIETNKGTGLKKLLIK